jgi:hypothetical protein
VNTKEVGDTMIFLHLQLNNYADLLLCGLADFSGNLPGFSARHSTPPVGLLTFNFKLVRKGFWQFFSSYKGQ